MSNTFAVQNRSQVIVPVRFQRAVTGAPQLDAPDLDDRGWNNPHPANWTDVGVRGAFFGILNGETVKVKLVREQLDAGAPLFVTVRVPGGAARQVQIVTPVAPAAVDATGVFTVRGTANSAVPGAGNVLEARLGSATGPVICECEVRVLSPARVMIAPHVCNIFTAGSAAAAGLTPASARWSDGVTPQVAGWLTTAKAIWRHSGVELIDDAVLVHDYFGAPFSNSVSIAGVAPGSGGWLVASNFVATAPGRINIYFCSRTRAGPLGIGVHRGNLGVVAWTHPGIIIAVDGDATAANVPSFNRPSAGADLVQEIGNDVAHEIGHFLTLSHFAGVNSPGRSDTYGRRNLMHPNNLLPPVGGAVRRADCGYGTGGGGAGHRGCLITYKQHNLFAPGVGALQVSTLDSQTQVARMQILQSPGRPFPGTSLY